MNVELTIQEMFDEYPTLFKERADCLNHLFCAIGNGYEWVNGELVEIPETPASLTGRRFSITNCLSGASTCTTAE